MYAKPEALWRSEDDLWGVEGSKLAMRGPARDLGHPFVAVLGGSETFGKGVARPYPSLLEEMIGMPVVNLGVMHAGASLFTKERWLLDVAGNARLTVIQILGAQNMSNRLYCVHPRRNDRFLTTSSALRLIYPEVDFSEVNFTGHLLRRLEETSSERFSIVVEELRWAWVQRMRRVVTSIRGDVELLWLSDRKPEDTADTLASCEPMFVTRTMLEELAPHVSGVTEVITGDSARQTQAALHERAANALAERIGPRLGKEKGPDPEVEARLYE